MRFKTGLTIAVLAALLLGGCAGFVRQRIYHPSPVAAAPQWTERAPVPFTVRTTDGIELSGLFWAPVGANKDIIVYFHGNGGSLYRDALRAEPLASGGRGVIMTSYRGFSGNGGRPSEAGLLRDAAAYVDFARARLPQGGKLYLFGHSLGGAVALGTAARVPVDGVATLGAFASLTTMAPGIARPFLPDRFDNEKIIGRIAAPVILFHGTNDAIVPYEHAARLQGAAPLAMLVTLQGASHHPQMDRLAPMIWMALGSDVGDRHPPEPAPWR